MSYGENWFQHLFAPLTGEGLNNHLARDFWSKEDLWNPTQTIRHRFLKLWWVYSASALAQITLPLAITAFIISRFQQVSPKWWGLAIGGATVLGFVFAFIVAVFTYWGVRRAEKPNEA